MVNPPVPDDHDCFTNRRDAYISENSSLSLKPSSDLSLLVNQFNNSSPEQKTDPKNVVNSNYYDTDQLQTLKFLEKSKQLFLFHINTCSLNKNSDDLQHLLKCTNKVFDIVAVSETRIMKKTSLTSNISLNNYSFECTPTESTAGGTLLYIANHLSYKSCNDLNLYKTNQLESTFIEILNSKKSNIFVGCLYKHPVMDNTDFNKNYLNPILDKISKENKQVFLLGDFNIDLLNYNDHQPTNEFLDSLASNSFLPYILQPTRLTSHSKTLIDNIFSNVISHEVTSGNITATISDHLPQFLFVPNVFSNPSCQKSNIYERDWSKFVQQNFVLDYFDKDWSDVLQLDQQDVNLSINSFLDKMNSILDEHAQLKRVNKYKLKFKSKPWITPAIQISISVKNKVLKRFIDLKDPQAKDIFHEQYKDYRYMLSTLLKKSKTNYYNQYFEANMNNIKNTWKGIKSILTIKNTSSDFPKCLSSNGSTFTNQVEISNIFNNYFASIAEKVNINYSHKHFFDFLKIKIKTPFF